MTPDWSDLPEELTVYIFSLLPKSYLSTKLVLVCKKWQRIADDGKFWPVRFTKRGKQQKSRSSGKRKRDIVDESVELDSNGFPLRELVEQQKLQTKKIKGMPAMGKPSTFKDVEGGRIPRRELKKMDQDVVEMEKPSIRKVSKELQELNMFRLAYGLPPLTLGT